MIIIIMIIIIIIIMLQQQFSPQARNWHKSHKGDVHSHRYCFEVKYSIYI